MARDPTILVFDSGLGGLTVFAEVVKLRPDAHFVYAADDADFPYGGKPEAEVVTRVLAIVGRLIAETQPDVVVIACNTASTLVLPDLRAAFPATAFVGTVPAIKPAAAQSRSKLISVLATPGTVTRDYTRSLIDHFAAHCAVTLVGSPHLATLAEAAMIGQVVADEAIAREIAPCFVERDGARTDCVVLACTHYPLLRDRFAALARWPVDWFDPAPAIARRIDHVLAEMDLARQERRETVVAPGRAIFTSGLAPSLALRAVLRTYELAVV